MENLLADFGPSTHVSFPVIAMRLLLATLLGAAIGFEREWHQRPAGLRTHILVCLAAATAAIVAIEIAHVSYFEGDNVRLDPIRLVEAVTSGVAFLAAGFIIFARGEVHGLTTAAGMWLAGAVGLAAGLGFWTIAGLSALLGIIVLWLLRLLESGLDLNKKGSLPREGKAAKEDTPSGTNG